MADDGSSPQSFKNANLDLLWAKSVKLVETFPKAGKGFAWKARDQIGVNVNIRFGSKPPDVFDCFGVVLAPTDQPLNFGIERLNSYFKLELCHLSS